MTATERMELSDTIGTVWIELEKARFILSDIEDFFDLSPNTSDGLAAIRYDFPKRAAYISILADLLCNITAHLPSTQWIDGLKTEEGAKA